MTRAIVFALTLALLALFVGWQWGGAKNAEKYNQGQPGAFAAQLANEKQIAVFLAARGNNGKRDQN